MSTSLKSKHPNISRLNCSNCDYTANQTDKLKSHQKSCLKNGKIHECDECGYKSGTIYGLGIHIKKAHLELPVAPKWKCQECDFQDYSR